MNTELNLKQLTALIEKLRRPPALFAITACAALIMLIALYFQLVYPVQARIQAAESELADMKAVKEQAEALPAPEELSESMVSAIAAMLPSKPDAAAILGTLRGIEAATGTEILTLERAEADEPETAQKNLAASEGQMQDFLEAVETEEEKRAVTVGSGLTELRYDLTAQGDYAGLLKFMDSLREAQRIIRVDSWRIAVLTDPSSEASATERVDDDATSGHSYELTVSMRLYYTDQFASLFDGATKE